MDALFFTWVSVAEILIFVVNNYLLGNFSEVQDRSFVVDAGLYSFVVIYFYRTYGGIFGLCR